MVKFRLGQKVTIVKENFFAPVNGYIVGVHQFLNKNDLSNSFSLTDYINRCSKSEYYDVAYEQKGFMDKIETKRDLDSSHIEAGWHGMKSNGDDAEFIKFGITEIHGRKLGKNE